MTRTSYRFGFVEVDTRGLRALGGQAADLVSVAANDVVATSTRRVEKALEAATRTVTRGNLWRAWASETYPKGERLSLRPAGFVYPRGGARTRGAITSIAEGAVIRGRRGQMLAIPIRNPRTALTVLKGRYAETLTPALWERRAGQKLAPLPRAGKPTLLIVKPPRRDERGRGRVTLDRPGEVVPVFVLLPFVTVRQRLSVSGTVAGEARRMAAELARRINSWNAGNRGPARSL